ncbi:hypothetical protein H632_c2503p1 [Helicosporidium sp. ATCC 50920]|nr:hypothetical protein H632_c2503p1 [Helicosporidium sp. ATCC 50920]|eukprot:KDD73132.1 hypothetical protein H632_c2503p1 [Helicosporidium sp. ATCC 50920]
MAKVGAGLSVVDMPGHPKVRREWEAHVPTTCGIIFVLDSVDFLPKRVATAECVKSVSVAVGLPLLQGCVLVPPTLAGKPAIFLLPRQLYDVLTFPEVVSRRIPVLIACNKADLGSRAHSLEFVKRRLEKELEELRESRADLDRDCGRDARPLAATPGESFTFEEHSALSHCPVIFAATASNSQDGIADVLKFVGTRL